MADPRPLVEAVARAWCFAEGGCDCQSESDCGHWKVWVEAGGPAAAIRTIAAALREPSEAMVNAFDDATADGGPWTDECPKVALAAMLAAFLREQGVDDAS